MFPLDATVVYFRSNRFTDLRLICIEHCAVKMTITGVNGVVNGIDNFLVVRLDKEEREIGKIQSNCNLRFEMIYVCCAES